MGLIKTSKVEEWREQEDLLEEAQKTIEYWKGKAEALEMVIKLLTQNYGKTK